MIVENQNMVKKENCDTWIHDFIVYIKTDDVYKDIAKDPPKQVCPFLITAKQRPKIIFHLENGTCRKLMPYHQDPDLFLRNHSSFKNIFTYFKKESF